MDDDASAATENAGVGETVVEEQEIARITPEEVLKVDDVDRGGTGVEALCLAGGGMRMFGTIGVLLHMDRTWPGHLKKLIHVWGVSSGSLLGLMIVLGYTAQEMWDVLSRLDIDGLRNSNTVNLITHWGMDMGTGIVALLIDLLEGRGLSRNTTFDQLYALTGKEFVVVATDLNTEWIRYLRRSTDPEMSVVKAVRASMSVPLVLVPVKHQGHFLVDGGCINNFPLKEMQAEVGGDPRRCLGILLSYHDGSERVQEPNDEGISGIASYMVRTLDTVMKGWARTRELLYENHPGVIIVDPAPAGMPFTESPSPQQQDLMLQLGVAAALRHFRRRDSSPR